MWPVLHVACDHQPQWQCSGSGSLFLLLLLLLLLLGTPYSPALLLLQLLPLALFAGSVW